MTYHSGTSSSASGTPSPWHRSRPGADDRHTSLFFWLTVLTLGCVTLFLVTWGASNVLANKGSEKLLRVDLLFPKLKGIHRERKAEAFRMSEPGPSELAHPKERRTPDSASPAVIDQPKVAMETPEPPGFVSPPPGLNLIPLIELPPLSETCNDPAVYMHPCSPQPGDSPMIRNWKTLTLYSLLSAAAITFAPPPAMLFAGDKKDPSEELQKSLQALIKRITALEDKKAPVVDLEPLAKMLRAEIKKLDDGTLADLGKRIKGVGDDVTEVKKSVGEVKDDIAGLRLEQVRQKLDLEKQKKQIELLAEDIAILQKRLATTGGSPSPAPAVDKAFMEEIRGSLKSLQDTVAKMGPSKERISLSPPNGSIAPIGRVMLVNLYTDDLLFLVNGTPYRVPAGMSRLIDNVPVGAVQYRVHSDRWGTLANSSTTLAPSDTFTLTASNPR